MENRARGIGLRVGAVSTFAAMMAALKYATVHGAGPVEVLFFRNLFALPTIIAWVAVSGGLAAVRTRRPSAHLTRSALGLCVMFCTFLALSKLPLAEATVISFSAPLFATMLSALILREKVFWHRWTAIVLGFVGVLVAVNPVGSTLPLMGVIIALIAALGTALVVITLRQIGETESATATVFWFNVASVVVTLIPMPFVYNSHSGDVWLALMIGGIFGGVAQIMMTAAVRFAPVSVLAPFDYLQLVWATLWGVVLFEVAPTINGAVGGVLIAGAGCYVVWRERRQRKITVTAGNEL
ncbi:DMT family transporter [Novosphingobium sp. Chol11]|uniref:DMT family transporter n=1 Tax=Novosphingobium sp. Chol11 TaxID=1385763 RepID=UPI000BE3E23F|nr:DMT family transporter [Novosphingobium sp. Chol11]